MSTCPEKDLHSIYLDGEMPESVLKVYETHIIGCEKCKKILNSLKKVKEILVQEKESIQFTPKELDDSFLRLQAKLSYTKHKKFMEKRRSFKMRYFVSGAAAAAFAFLFIPFIANRTVSESRETFKAIARTKLISPASAVMATLNIDETLCSDNLKNAFKDTDSMQNVNSKQLSHISPLANLSVISSKISHSSSVKNFARYDIFAPAYDYTDSVPSFEKYNNTTSSFAVPVAYTTYSGFSN